MYLLQTYSNIFAPKDAPHRGGISGALIEKHAKTTESHATPVIGVGHYGSRDCHRTKQFSSVRLQTEDFQGWLDQRKGYSVPIARSTFQVSGQSALGFPSFTQFLVDAAQVSQERCFVQLCPGFRYGGSLITGDIPLEKRSITKDYADNAIPFEDLEKEGLEVLLRGEAATGNGSLWATHYLVLLPRDLVLRVEYGGSSTFPRVVDYLRFNGQGVEVKTLEQRLSEGCW